MKVPRASLTLPGLLRASLLLLAAALLFVPAALRTGIYLKVEVAAGLATLLSVLFVRPSRSPALNLAVAGLLAGDILNTRRYLLPDFPGPQMTIMAAAYLLYTLAAAYLLLRAYYDSGPRERTETGALLGLSVCFAFLQLKYVFVPASALYRFPYFLNVLVTLHTMAESLVLALAVLLGMRARSRYWFYLLNGFTLLPLASFAFGYDIAADKGVPFSEYGWVLGLLSLLAAQTYAQGEGPHFASWSSVRVRLVWFVSSVSASLLLLLYLMQDLVAKDAFRLTSSLFFVLYGAWLIANLIAFRVSEDINALLEGLEGPGPAGGVGFRLVVSEAELFAERLKAAYATIKSQSQLAALAEVSAQVAHDIRSPLAALDSALRDVPQLPDEKRLLIRGAAGRIRDIAEDLLEKNGGRRRPEPCRLAELIRTVVAEKQAQFRGRGGVAIVFSAGRDQDGLLAAAVPADLGRVLSNLINNGVEALRGGGTVTVSLSAEGEEAVVAVGDTGRGIPPEVLASLGRRGKTYGKEGGSGLGLYHAMTTVESWGGRLSMDSEQGKGTTVTLRLTRVQAPPSAAAGPGKRTGKCGARAVLLDDDALVRLNWGISARSAGVELATYENGEELLSGSSELPADTAFYIDSELGGGESGVEVAAKLREKGFSDITMATGSGPENFASLPWLKVAGKEPPWESAG